MRVLNVDAGHSASENWGKSRYLSKKLQKPEIMLCICVLFLDCIR